ncbi:MAG: triose-phosphate isomerase [Anaerolineaceae bacterium]|nr:triose-phosphate isomerase [Anaerolineaceae bacterium]
MRTPIIAGNWKMHKTVAEAIDLAQGVCNAVKDISNVDVVLCPTFTALSAVKDIVEGTNVGLGAQNMYWEVQGAFTGEISPVMLAELCDYVILGHSERRQYFGETDEGVNKKIKAALAHSLIPIVCVGEDLSQNEAGETETFVGGQVKAAFDGLSPDEAPIVIVAYEPIWAIGTGKTADPTMANGIIKGSIRGVLANLYGDTVAEKIRVQYGGSVKPDNIAGFMAQPDIDGALVGGASLKVDSFLALVEGSA